MRATRALVIISTLNFVLFLPAWGLRAAPMTLPPYAGDCVNVFYWLTAFFGLCLAVYGFLVVTKGKPTDFKRSIVCVLFATAPGCVGLIALLSMVGTKPV